MPPTPISPFMIAEWPGKLQKNWNGPPLLIATLPEELR